MLEDDALRGATSLCALLSSSYGPLPGEKLVVTATGKAIFTCSGPSLLTAVGSDSPLQGLVLQAAQAHGADAGDGTKAFVIMLAAALEEVVRQQGCLPGAHRRAWRARLARAACWLAQEGVPRALAPRLREQARQTAVHDAVALRADAAKVAATAFGGHLGATASASLAGALVEALLPASHASAPPARRPAAWPSSRRVAPSPLARVRSTGGLCPVVPPRTSCRQLARAADCCSSVRTSLLTTP